MFLVLRGAPAAVDVELDAVSRGFGCRPAQCTEQVGVEPGDTGNLVVEDRGAIGYDAVSRAERTTALTGATVERWRGHGGRGRRRGRRHGRLERESRGERRDDDERAGDAGPADPDPAARCSCWSAVGHGAIEGSVVLPGRMRFSIRPRYAPARSIGACASCS